MEPIIKLIRNIMSDNKEAVFKITKSLGIPMTSEEQTLIKKDLMKNIFMKWLNAAEALLEMVVAKLPSPIKAQKYRVPQLYEGPDGDKCSEAMKNCDPNGPLMVYISKMV
jgi:elongation factor 2